MSDRRQQRFMAMARTAELVNTCGSPEDALAAIMDLAMTTVGAERGFIMLIDPDSGELVWRIVRNFESASGASALGLSRTLVQNVYDSQEPYFNLDVKTDDSYKDVASVRLFGLRAIICVPLIVKGRRVGVIYLDNRTRNGSFEAEDVDFVSAFSHQAAMTLDQAMLKDLQVQHARAVEREQRDAIGTLAAGVAHEINNPLGTILINAQMLVQDAARPEERQSLDRIVDGARRAKEVVDRLLTWFRAGTDAEVTRFNLLEAVGDIVLLTEAEVQVSGPPDLDVELSRSALAQILMALLDNARLAIEGGPHGTVQVEVQDTAIDVVDNGVGMSAAILPHVFDPFFTTRPPGRGQGLGLFVARGLAEKMGGHLDVVRSTPAGTCVRLTLPDS